MPCVGYMHIGNLFTPFAITINEIKLLPVTFQLSLVPFYLAGVAAQASITVLVISMIIIPSADQQASL